MTEFEFHVVDNFQIHTVNASLVITLKYDYPYFKVKLNILVLKKIY